MSKIINNIFVILIKFYQLAISPFLPDSCRFYPSCSEYSLQSFKNFPWYKALWLSVTRIGKCHPWHEGGIDPVPNNEKTSVKNG